MGGGERWEPFLEGKAKLDTRHEWVHTNVRGHGGEGVTGAVPLYEISYRTLTATVLAFSKCATFFFVSQPY